ncbi:arylsulfatase [Pseudoalteromonas sp. KAN5]|uniref:arylsulfatase n=1 Tax=Pseudoalteromonas sp. KAN5 TaxID=2916633 RepID=UPI001FCA4E35|nr:arylsulfatase [Pseudoalteromonas sp. KAN5]BDF94358.1 arylsulfatase [Pseudoalteromonas sp. KAN5]
MNNIKIFIFSCCTCLFLFIGSAFAKTQPNVLMIMVDNLGYGELGVYGGGSLRGAPTPNIDTLAAQGLRLTNFNVEPQCTPSRSALMTGRHPIRSGTTKVVWGMLYGLTQWEQTLPELLSEKGYSTGMFGKWHLGDTDGRFPTNQGFDEWYGIANTTDESQYSSQYKYDGKVGLKPVVQEAKRNKTPTDIAPYDLDMRRQIDTDLTAKAIDFMTRQVKADKPFFAYVPLTQVHLPTLPHPDFIGVTGNGDFADSVVEMDHHVGEMVAALEKLGVTDNTIVIFASDNGPEEVAAYHGTSGYWRGHYFTALEGSLRAPFIVRWPNKIKSGTVSNEIIHMTDLLPTFAKIMDFELPDDRIIDGVVQTGVLFNENGKSAREGFPVYNGDEMYAYKWRDWKIHFIELNSMFGTPKKLNVPHIYNLTKDPKESYNIAPDSTWVLPVVMKKVIEFNKTLVKEPPIKLGTPDPYKPKG